MKDLVSVVADKNMEFTLDAVLKGEIALGIRAISKEIFPLHSDGTTRVAGPGLLRMKQRTFSKGLLILDFKGSGTSHSKAKGFAFHSNGKPERPKEALQEVLRLIKKPRSSTLYGKIAQRISLLRCEDPAFHRLREQLRLWFPKDLHSFGG